MYKADKKRYENMQYNRCGRSGLKLPIVSLGLWHNFGDISSYDNMKKMCFLLLTFCPLMPIALLKRSDIYGKYLMDVFFH